MSIKAKTASLSYQALAVSFCKCLKVSRRALTVIAELVSNKTGTFGCRLFHRRDWRLQRIGGTPLYWHCNRCRTEWYDSPAL